MDQTSQEARFVRALRKAAREFFVAEYGEDVMMRSHADEFGFQVGDPESQTTYLVRVQAGLSRAAVQRLAAVE